MALCWQSNASAKPCRVGPPTWWWPVKTSWQGPGSRAQGDEGWPLARTVQSSDLGPRGRAGSTDSVSCQGWLRVAIWDLGVGPRAVAERGWEWSGVTWDPEADLDVVAQGCTENESRAPDRRAPTLRVVSTRAWGDADETLPVLVLVTILRF